MSRPIKELQGTRVVDVHPEYEVIVHTSGEIFVRHKTKESYIILNYNFENPDIEATDDLGYNEYVRGNSRGFDIVIGPDFEDVIATVEVW